MTSNGLAYRSEIDGLRAIAVLSVVLYHVGIAPRAGFVGVDIFFVISGYLITALLLREHDDTGRIDLFAFYARRVRRIFPAAVVVVLAVLAVCPLLLPPEAMIRAVNSAAAAAVFVANIFFQSMTGGYFDPRAEDMPLLHLWSLSVEEQFYVLWPALLIGLLRWRPALLPQILAGLGLASLLLAELLIHANSDAAFYQMPARFWELAAGGLVAVSSTQGTVPRWLPATGIALIVAACGFPVSHFPALGALPVVAGTAALLLAIHRGCQLGLTGRWLRSRPMVGIGLISYSLYLWHWPLLALYRATTIGEGSTQSRLMLCAVAMLLAYASYRYVEQPFRRLRTRSGRVVLAGAFVSLTLALGACGWGYQIKRQEDLRPADNPLAVRAENDLPAGWQRCHYEGWAHDFPRRGCESAPGKTPSIAMWGDSTAMAWKPLAWQLAKQEGRTAIDFSRDSCPPLIGYMSPDNVPNDANCRDFNAEVSEAIGGMDTVILVARWGSVFAPDRVDRATKGLIETLARIAPRARRVLVIGPTPEMRDAVPKCIRANKLDACAVTRAQFDSGAQPIRDRIRTTAAPYENVYIVDPTDFFCNASVCQPVKQGIPLYWDRHHVTATAASAFARNFHAAAVPKSKPIGRVPAR